MTIIPPETKRCTECGEMLPASMFYQRAPYHCPDCGRQIRDGGGLRSRCKKCEIKISVVVDEKYLELGVRTLHSEFGLQDGAMQG